MLDKRSRLVIVGAGVQTARVAGELDCEVVHLQRPGGQVADLVRTGDRYYSVDFESAEFDSFVQQVLAPLRVDAVVSITEAGLLPAARATELLGLPGTPLSVVRRLRDKHLMRQRLTELGLDELSVRYATVTGSEQVPDLLAAWGPSTRAILKPRLGTASHGVRLVDEHSVVRLDDRPGGWLLEEYAPGAEFSVESFSVSGTHRVVAITEKLVSDTFVELAHVTPPIGLDEVGRTRVVEVVRTFLDAMQLSDGPAHTELKHTPGRTTVIESHNRVGGDGISTLAYLATGTPLMRWSLEWPLRSPAELARPACAAAAVAFAVAEPGLVVKVSTPQWISESPGIEGVQIFVRPGDRVGTLASSADRVARVIATGPDPAAALARAQWAVRQLGIVTAAEPSQA